MTDPFDRTWAVVPLRGLATAKTRLGGELDRAARMRLVRAMAERTLSATRDAGTIAGTVLVTADPDAARLAERYGARTLVQLLPGLNEAILEARAMAVAAGASAIVVLPIDLPAVSPAAIDAVVESARANAGRGANAGTSRVVIVPDRHGHGTNVLVVAPPDAIEPAFGTDSRAEHRRRAETAGAAFSELSGPLVLDVDTPDDLLAASGVGPPDR